MLIFEASIRTWDSLGYQNAGISLNRLAIPNGYPELMPLNKHECSTCPWMINIRAHIQTHTSNQHQPVNTQLCGVNINYVHVIPATAWQLAVLQKDSNNQDANQVLVQMLYRVSSIRTCFWIKGEIKIHLRHAFRSPHNNQPTKRPRFCCPLMPMPMR